MQDILIDRLIQNLLRQQKRIQEIEYNQTLHFCVVRLVRFINDNPELSGIAEELKTHTGNIDSVRSAAEVLVSGNGAPDFDSEMQFVLRSLFVLEFCAAGDAGAENQAARAVSLEPSSHSVNRQAFSSIYGEPVISYFVDKLQNKQNILSALLKYRQKVEWFQRKIYRDLISECENTRVEENVLNPKVYEYMHDLGIEFYIEPHSQQARGRPDFISAQSNEPKLILDGKYLNNTSTAKQQIIEAFSQVYQYTHDFNRPDGYIVLFKSFKDDIGFSFTIGEQGLPVITRNGKKIYFLLIDISDTPSPSERGRLSEIQITEDELVNNINL